MLNIKTIEGLTSLPQISSQKELPEKAGVLGVVLTEESVSCLSKFHSRFTDEAAVGHLRKVKSAQFAGGKDDFYDSCYVQIFNEARDYDILKTSGEFTRNILKGEPDAITLYFPESISVEKVTTFVIGVLLTNYQCIQQFEKTFKRIKSVQVIHSTFNHKDDELYFKLLCTQYSLFCRQILNMRPLEANPETMLEFCYELAKIDSRISVEAIVGKELQEKGLNLIYSVGRGAAKKPCLAILKYEGNQEKPEDVIALVGKGVCFDAGGLNIKPTPSINEEWSDKGGACTVLSIFKAAVEMKMPLNIVCSVALVENLLGSDCYHPSDVLTSHKGLTVEIGNTDSEGRLILADAMSYTQKFYKPNTLIEFSTLTSGVLYALGLTNAGLFSNDDEFAKQILQSSAETTEGLWRLPIFEENRNHIIGKLADITNNPGHSYGAASNAAAFLEKFVEKDVKWAHIDIAGAAYGSESFVYSEGATGFGVRLALNYLRRRVNSNL